MVNIIFATGLPYADGSLPIGKDNKLPWSHKADMKWFRETTLGHTVIMGHNTFKSIGKPLPQRRNLVISSVLLAGDGYEVFSTLESAIETAQKDGEDEIFIIGGATLYKYAIDNEIADRIYVDWLDIEVECADTFFPLNSAYFNLPGIMETLYRKPVAPDAKAVIYDTKFGRWHKGMNKVDVQYQELVQRILENGTTKQTRSGEVVSLFGETMRFDLKNGLPVLTTKKMFMKGCVHELLWFIKGDTNIKYLVDNGVHIWDDDAYRYFKTVCGPIAAEQMPKEEFMKHLGEWHFGGYHYGDLGPVYGKQWTDWNGINQIEDVINTLRTNPDDRRMIISAWNVDEIRDMALPPCHYCCQFYTSELTNYDRQRLCQKKNNLPNEAVYDMTPEELDEEGIPRRKLSCMWNQRSVDTGLGLPFNIMSYGILTCMIAQCVNMVPGELIFSGGDVHVYKNQIDGLSEQCRRDPYRYSLPTLELNPEIKEISQFTYDDIKIKGYHSYPTIKLPLSVG
jgi:thymidylate synthase